MAAQTASRQEKEDSLENVAGNDMDLCIQRHNHHSHAVTSVLFAGNLIVAGSLDGAVSFINILFSEVIQRINVPTKCRGVTCVSELGAESASGTFVVGTESGRLVKVSMSDTSAVDYRAHSGCVMRVDATTLAKHRVVSSGADGCIRVCEAAALDSTLICLRVHNGSVTSFVCFPDGSMWTGGTDGVIRNWQLNDVLPASGGKLGSGNIDLEGLTIRHRDAKERVQCLCRINFTISPDERTSSHVIAAFSDGSIRWFGAAQEKRRQEAAAAAAKPTSKAGDSGGKEKGKGKGKGSPKGKGKKSSKAKGDDGDGANEAFEAPFEGLWIVPGGRAAASVDTVSLPAHSILVAAAEDGRVYLWDMPRRRSGELSFGRSSSTPLYVIQGFSSGGLQTIAWTVLGLRGSLVFATGGVEHTVFLLDASNFQDMQKVIKINDERLKLKVEKAAAEIAAMKLASGAKKGKGKKGKEGNETAVIDVTVTEEVPVDLEPLPLPRYTRVMSIMLLHPGLPEHLQPSRSSRQAAQSSLPFARSCWSILPTRVFKRDMWFPLLGIRGHRSSSGGSSADEKKNSQFVIYEMFSSSPLIEHGAAEGDSVSLITAPSLSCEIALDGDETTYDLACDLMQRVDATMIEVKCTKKQGGRFSATVPVQQLLLQAVSSSESSIPAFVLTHSEALFIMPAAVFRHAQLQAPVVAGVCNEFLRSCHTLKSCYDWAASRAHQSWLPFIHTPSATEPPAYTPPPLKKGWAPLGMLWIALACFVKEDQLPSLAEATVMLHSAFVPSVLHSALPPPPSEIFNPWRNVSPKEFTCGLLRIATAAALNDAQANGGDADVLFHVKDMLEHMAMFFAGPKDGSEQQQAARAIPQKGFAADMIDADIASVFAQLALPLWNIATTFAIGTPPEHLMSPRQFCTLMEAVGMPIWSVHRALDRVFEAKRRATQARSALLSKAPPYEIDSERRFTFAEFCYSLLLVSDDLSNEQLMRCDDAERILAKRREALDIAAAAVPKSSSSSAAASASIAPESPNIVPDDSLNSYTPRSSRLLLFVQGIMEPALQELARKPLLPS